MITMELYNFIRCSHFTLGMSIRKVSREAGVSRQTVRKVIEGIEPKYNLKRVKEMPALGPHTSTIKEWLLADKAAPKKQRHTAKRIYDRLVEECDYEGSYSAVKRRVKRLKEELNLIDREVFIPSDPEKREGVEVDWGEATVELKGVLTVFYMFCMRSKYSGKSFVKLFPVMEQECFFNGHIEAFFYFGGCFPEIIYDNLSSAVKKVLKGRNRIEQDSFLRFRSHYCFKAEFCNIAKGNEKGGVEGLVGFARRNYLTPIPKGDSLEEINARLLEKCCSRDLETSQGQSQTIVDLFSQEKSRLLPLQPLSYNNYKLIDTRVDKFLTVRVKTNRYSVPSSYANKKVTIELGVDNVRITSGNRLIAEHKREFSKQRWILDPWHYIEPLKQKSRALKTSRILSAIEEKWDPVVKKLLDIQIRKLGDYEGTKDFLDTLLYFQDHSYSDMIVLMELGIERKSTNKDSLVVLYEMLMEKVHPLEEASTSHLKEIANFEIPIPDLDKFDALMEVRNG